MAEQNIYTGATGNDGTGDKLRVAFNKVNHNFDELYANDANVANSIGILSNNNSDLANSINQLGMEHDVSSNVANAAFAVANASFNAANNIVVPNISLVSTLANDAFNVANAAFNKANTSVTDYSPAFNKANGAYDVANAAYNYANTIIGENTNLGPVYDTANAAFNKANNIVTANVGPAFDVANAAYNYANTIVGENTNLTPVFDTANAAFGVANGAYDLAASAYDYANTIIGENTNLTDVFNVANAAFGAANSIVVSDITLVSTLANDAFDVANAAFGYANTLISENTNLGPVYDVANAAFGAANSIVVPDVSLVSTLANDAFEVANAAFGAANSIVVPDISLVSTLANDAFEVANAAFGAANNIVVPNITPAYNTANAAYNIANDIFAVVNSAYTLANTSNIANIHINDLIDVDINYGTILSGYVLKWDGSKWAAGVDDTTGGGGSDADTLDGQHGSYYLDYNNFANTPNLQVYAATTDISNSSISANNYAGAMVNAANGYAASTYLANTNDAVFNGTLHISNILAVGTYITADDGGSSDAYVDLRYDGTAQINDIRVPSQIQTNYIAGWQPFQPFQIAQYSANVDIITNEHFDVRTGGGYQYFYTSNTISYISSSVGIGRTDVTSGYKVDVVGTINASNILINGQPITVNLQPVYDVANAAFDKSNSANVLAYNTGIGANAYAVTIGASSNAWANTILTNGTSNVTFNNVTATNITTSKLTKLGGTEEAFGTYNSVTGITQFDCTNNYIFYITPAGNFTANLTNFTVDTNNVTSVTFVLNQGGTPYMSTGNLLIGAANLAINWQGGTAPTGTASNKDVLTLSILNVNGANTILGQLVSFG